MIKAPFFTILPAFIFTTKKSNFPIGYTFFRENLLPGFGLRDLYHTTSSIFGRYKSVAAFAITNKHVSFGKNEWTDEAGRVLGTFDSYDNFTILTIASNLENLTVSSNYALGLNLKYIYSKLSDVPVGNENRKGIAKIFAIDFGYLYREPFFEILSFGLTLQNMGPDVVYIDHNQADPLPFNIKLSFAASYSFRNLVGITTVLDLNRESIKRNDSQEYFDNHGYTDPPDFFGFGTRCGKSFNSLGGTLWHTLLKNVNPTSPNTARAISLHRRLWNIG